MKKIQKAGLSICFRDFPFFHSEIHAFIPFFTISNISQWIFDNPYFYTKEVL